MSIFDQDDLNYMNTQFSTLTTSVEYDKQEQQDPWKTTLTPDSILHNVDLPTIYDDYYNLISNHHQPSLVAVSALTHLLDSANGDSLISEKIVSLVSGDSLSPPSYLNRIQFDLALALLACSQHGLDLTLENVYQKRLDLPIPKLPDKTLFDTTPSPSISSSLWYSVISSTTMLQQPQDTNPNDRGDDENHTRNRSIQQRKPTNSSKKDTVKDYQWYLDMDLITVTLIPQKEGRLFKHVRYLVTSQHGGISVTRRYSEFYLLWSSLLKRYPLRSVPNLPPKKIKANDGFLEKRRRGLARFMNSLERHPVLGKDELVEAFLSYQDLQQWWKTHRPSMDDEFIRTMSDIDSLRTNIPHDMPDRLKRLQRRITPAIKSYDNMITSIQQLASNEQGEANEFIRYSIILSVMAEDEQQQQQQQNEHSSSTSDPYQGHEKVAQSMQAVARLLDDKALSLTNTFTEQLNYHRHLFISFKDMLNRRDQLLETIADQQHTIPKSIAAQMIIDNQPTVPSAQILPTMVYHHQRQLSNNQINNILKRDHVRESLHQHRLLFIHSCLASELTYLHKQQVFISLMYQDLVRQQYKWASEQCHRWKSLQQELDDDYHTFV
ncbi:hypothetical protein BC941DRAFT_430895, partial [Chlamydoabsidia padenii]